MKYLATLIILLFLISSNEILQAQWVQTNGLNEGQVNCLAVSGSNIFAGSDNGIYLSTNDGLNWTLILPTDSWVYALIVNGTNIFAGTLGGGVYLSTNNGTNWTQKGMAGNDVFSLIVSGSNIFAGTLWGGVYLSTNNGTNWTQVNNGLPSNTGVSSFAVNGTNIFTGISSGGVWRRPLSEFTDVAKEINDLPQEFTLSQNYPNPFNPSTVIKYAIPFESNINIRFYNSLGQCVREVDSGTRQAGYYEVNFSASGLASGVYFYSIKAISVDGKNNFSAVKKMIIIK